MVTCIVLAATPLYQHITRFVHPISPALTKPLNGLAGDGSSTTLYVFKCLNDLDIHNRPQTSVQGGLSGLILAWANELNGHDNESTSAVTDVRSQTSAPDTGHPERAFIVANCNMWAYVMQAWLPMCALRLCLIIAAAFSHAIFCTTQRHLPSG